MVWVSSLVANIFFDQHQYIYQPPPPHSYNHHCHIHIHLPLPPLKTTTIQCKLSEHKLGICTSGWKEKTTGASCKGETTTRASGDFVPMVEGETPVVMLVLTFAPCTLTFALCVCGGCHRQQLTVVVFLPQPLAQIVWF